MGDGLSSGNHRSRRLIDKAGARLLVYGRALLALLLVIAPLPLMAQSGDPWLDRGPRACLRNLQLPRIPSADLYEVPVSTFRVAADQLDATTFVPLSEARANVYLLNRYEASPAKRPYLVRALYGHGATGEFLLYWCGNKLVVTHHSLGKSWHRGETALVVRLERPPSEVIGSMSIAE